jgi:predicted metalloprotease with PDZ domain
MFFQKNKVICIFGYAATFIFVFFCLSASTIYALGDATNLHLETAQTEELSGSYFVKIKKDAPLIADVQAQIPVKDGHLYMAPWGADFLPNGWATFVRELQITDEKGRSLPFAPAKSGEWQISNGYNGVAKLSYQVDLSFTKSKWRSGNEQAGIFQENALFIVSKALFIISDAAGERQIKFELPPNWKSSTPWPSTSAQPQTFIATNNEDLIDNSIVLGEHVEYVFREGNFTFTLALLGSVGKSKDLVAITLKKVFQNYLRIFNKTPPSKYLMTIFYADEADAEAFKTSSAFSERDIISKNNLIRWGNTLAHEFFHSWNGHQIQGADYASSQWFSEGFTEYFANLALVQQKLISEDLFVKKMENNLGLYFYFNVAPVFENVSLKEAGSNKGRNRLGVYNGGWTIAFCLDVLIRNKTQNRKSLEDFIRLMYQKYGLTAKKYRYEDLLTTASETIGYDLTDFFKRYVEGKEMLPVSDYLNDIGLAGYTQFYDGEIYIQPFLRATQEAKMMQRSLISGK